jgi:hypothetical protein
MEYPAYLMELRTVVHSVPKGNMFQDLQRLCEIADNTERYI